LFASFDSRKTSRDQPCQPPMESFKLDYADSTVHLALFQRVSNSKELRSRLISASTLPDDEHGNQERATVDYAFIDAAMVSSISFLTTVLPMLTLSSDVIRLLLDSIS